MRTILCALCLGFLAHAATSQEPVAPPRFVTVSAMDKDKRLLELTEVQTVMVPQTYVKEVIRDGKTVQVAYTMYKPEYRKLVSKLALDGGESYDAGGKKLTGKEVIERLRVGSTVLISADGKKVDAA